jgi:sugar phosphate isomerase/epimerase
MPYPLSIQMYTVRELTKTDFFGTLQKIADIGYAAIEGGPPAGTSDAEFKKRLDDLGMRISSAWAWPTKANAAEIAERAKLYGYTTITNGFWIPELETREKIQAAGEKLKASAEALAPYGLTFCVHNHWFEFDRLNGQLKYDLLLAAAGPAVQCELDIYWASNFGQMDVPAIVKQWADRTPLLHVKDGPLQQDAAQTAVGSGKLDVAACINAADPKVLKYLVVELDNYAHGHEKMMNAVRDSYHWLTSSGLGIGRK